MNNDLNPIGLNPSLITIEKEVKFTIENGILKLPPPINRSYIIKVHAENNPSVTLDLKNIDITNHVKKILNNCVFDFSKMENAKITKNEIKINNEAVNIKKQNTHDKHYQRIKNKVEEFLKTSNNSLNPISSQQKTPNNSQSIPEQFKTKPQLKQKEKEKEIEADDRDLDQMMDSFYDLGQKKEIKHLVEEQPKVTKNQEAMQEFLKREKRIEQHHMDLIKILKDEEERKKEIERLKALQDRLSKLHAEIQQNLPLVNENFQMLGWKAHEMKEKLEGIKNQKPSENEIKEMASQISELEEKIRDKKKNISAFIIENSNPKTQTEEEKNFLTQFQDEMELVDSISSYLEKLETHLSLSKEAQTFSNRLLKLKSDIQLMDSTTLKNKHEINQLMAEVKSFLEKKHP